MLPSQSLARRLLLVSLVSGSLLACTGEVDQAAPAGGAQGVAVTVTPSEVAVAPEGATQFAADVTGTANTSVTWSVQEAGGGTVSTTGLYTAPATAGTFHVRATSAADPTRAGTATVTVSAPQVVAVTLSPTTGALNACRTLQFTATVTGTPDTSVNWSVQEGPTGGTITAAGLYTSPSGAGTYHVVATSVADPTKSAVATVTVAEVVLAVAVTPSSITTAPGGTTQFTATVTNTCGTFTSTSVLSATGKLSAN